MRPPEAGAALRVLALALPLAVLLALPLALPVRVARASEEPAFTLRYGFAPGQTWHAVQTVESETTAAGVTGRHTGTARFRYDVKPGAGPGSFRLDARMLSQETSGGESPFDFSVIHFVAQVDARGEKRGMHFQLGDAEPPELPGVEQDPVAFRQMLRSLASAWLESVYWLPVLPEHPIAVGGTFLVEDRGDVGGTEPGVAMEMRKQTVYRLREVTGALLAFDVEARSTIDAATAQSGITSSLRARGEAIFDRELGMWRHQEIRSQHQASLRGAESGDERASARTRTRIEMRPGPPPGP